VLNLAEPTSPGWAARACGQLDELLLDHAHCEKKAAGAALQLVFRYPGEARVVAAAAPLAREELAHFERVLVALQARGLRFRPQRPSPYGARLHALVRRSEPERLLDLLLVSALIEARSCERFRLLADAVPEPELAALYRDLLASEARHHGVYLELAQAVSPHAEARLGELARAEAAILREPPPFARLHT
jgi:tRNA-(ms[2]io[6]A)-hydroxylase